MVVRLWDLETGEDRVIGPVAGQTSYLGYVGDRQLLWAGADARTEDEAGGGERLFDLELGTVEVLSEGGSEQFRAMSPEGTFVVSTEMLGSMTDYSSRLVRRDLETGESTVLQTHGDITYAVDLDPTGRFVATGDFSDGAVRVGSVNGDEPYIFYGHTAEIQAVAISPDGRWIASSSYDGTVRLTPMPDLSKPPLHTLPHDELIAKLKTLTNLRVVRDEASPTGWNVEIGPFPGWAEVPEW
jgi:WD40 repeat protein